MKVFARHLHQWGDDAMQMVCLADVKTGSGIHKLTPKDRVVVDLIFEDAQAGCGTFLPRMPKG